MEENLQAIHYFNKKKTFEFFFHLIIGNFQLKIRLVQKKLANIYHHADLKFIIWKLSKTKLVIPVPGFRFLMLGGTRLIQQSCFLRYTRDEYFKNTYSLWYFFFYVGYKNSKDKLTIG